VTEPSGPEKALGYEFSHGGLLEEALTHGSSLGDGRAGMEHSADYGRLEFLGDAVLELVTREFLLGAYPGESEGDLTRRKIRIVRKESLAHHGRRLGLPAFARLGKGFEGSRASAADSLAADLVEAVTGAIYLDAGLETARQFVMREILDPYRAERLEAAPDSRSWLQEVCQSRGLALPDYMMVSRTGPDHEPVYTAAVTVDGEEVGRGSGPTGSSAREAAAAEAIAGFERKS
jgi:ribonuclease III